MTYVQTTYHPMDSELPIDEQRPLYHSYMDTIGDYTITEDRFLYRDATTKLTVKSEDIEYQIRITYRDGEISWFSLTRMYGADGVGAFLRVHEGQQVVAVEDSSIAGFKDLFDMMCIELGDVVGHSSNGFTYYLLGA